MNTLRNHQKYGAIPTSNTPRGADPGDENGTHQQHQHNQRVETILNICINILNWYAFAIFGYLSDVLGQVFFGDHDGSDEKDSLVQSFAVFGISFLVRPLGGLFFGYVGDRSSRHLALVSCVLLMAVATILMGCLPTYDTAGPWSYRSLILVRLLQGLAAGGQLMTSLVFGVESYPKHQWGLMGSFVLTAANFGNFLSGASVYWLRRHLTEKQLANWGWRATNLISGTMLFVCGLILKNIVNPVEIVATSAERLQRDNPKPNPLKLAFALENRRSLLAACMVPVLGSSGFWLTFVWMAIYMYKLSPHPLVNAFGINAWALFLGIIVFFPAAGHLSDVWGRRNVMAFGGFCFGTTAPLGVLVISMGNQWWAFAAQLIMGFELSLWCAPMAAWLAESFEPQMRLTSVAVGYNLGVGIFSGVAPALATYMVQKWGHASVGVLFVLVSIIGLVGLLVVAPAHATKSADAAPRQGEIGRDTEGTI